MLHCVFHQPDPLFQREGRMLALVLRHGHDDAGRQFSPRAAPRPDGRLGERIKTGRDKLRFALLDWIVLSGEELKT